MTPPAIHPVEDTDGDGALTARDRPSVLVVTHTGEAVSPTDLVRLDGRTGEQLGSLAALGGEPPDPGSGVSVGRLCDDLPPAALFLDDGGYVRAVDALTLEEMWVSEAPRSRWYRADMPFPLIARVSEAACASVFSGDLWLDHEGQLLRRFDEGWDDNYGTLGPIDVYDIGGDSIPEILRSDTWYDATGTVIWSSDWRPGDAIAALGTGADRLVVGRSPNGTEVDPTRPLGTWARDGNTTELLWSLRVRQEGVGESGMPAVGDIDGDGDLDIAVAGTVLTTALDAQTGLEIWTVETDTEGASQAAPLAFDFTADGADDIVVAGHDSYLYFVDGRSGTPATWDHFDCGRSVVQHPVLADVNGDGSGELFYGRSVTNPENAECRAGLVAYTSSSRQWFVAPGSPGFSMWRESNASDDLNPVYAGDLAVPGKSNLRARARVVPPDLQLEATGECDDDGKLSAAIEVRNNGGAGLTLRGLLVYEADGSLAELVDVDVYIPPGSAYGPISVPVGEGGRRVELLHDALVCTDDDSLKLPD